ncbi:inositol monophosphatase family protein [Ktedonobacter racemifer]|uniref:Inositol monophosphatase n=1 Tax=Ktedonobacter racemifer DSM 44963 TaxID=485913 RepID=D6TC38_KTERA|nr:inositol monophosphatase family protein [Ktedonobacter racemifer]EFH88074.1 inositol monophosphatase [Ktedonobacter racemifer DSM 44963]
MTSTTFVSLSEVPALIKIAEEASREAGRYLLEHLGQAQVQHRKAYKDDLLDVDLGSERIILSVLQREAPSIGVLSEEAGVLGRQDQYWTIDPVDGSANFQHGSPSFGIAIALIANQETVGGVIYLPTRNEIFTTIRGQGAYLNGEKISVSQVATVENALVHVGDLSSSRDPRVVEEGLKDFAAITAHVHRTRIVGSIVTELADVACGRADALVSRTSNPWDIEAGKLLVREAGGKITTITENRTKPLYLYSNGIIHDTFQNLFLEQ